MARPLTVCVVAALMGASIAAQQPKPRFEVASIKRNDSRRMSDALVPRVLPGGRLRAGNASVEQLLWFAYDWKAYRIVGGPDWARQEQFDITAKAENDAPADQIKLMVQSLLEDRFKLVTHVEQREMRYQALVRMRPDGPLGPGLVTMDACSPAIVNDLRRKFPEKYPSPGSGMMSACSSMGLDSLADSLTIGQDTPVIDATGLKGSFYFFIRSQFVSLPPDLAARVRATSNDPNLPALSTALAEQLGLRLESRRGPVDVLVIDSVQEPTEN